MVHGGGSGGGHGADRVDGGGAADVSFAGAAGQAGREHRSHQRGTVDAECGVVVVGGRSAEVWSRFRAARRSLRAHQRMAGGAERRVVAGSFFVFGKILPGGRQRFGAEAGVPAAADAVCGWRIARGEGIDRGEVRRVSDARRSAGARARENCGLEGTARAT